MNWRPIAIGILVGGTLLAGCSKGPSELPPDRDKALRDGFSRALTPEEVAQMGKAAAAGQGAGRPERKPIDGQ